LGDAVLGQCGEDFAHYVVDVGGGEEVASEGGGHFRAQAVGFEELVLGVGVEEAEGRVVAVPEHAALAVVGEGELAEFRVVGAWFGHLEVTFGRGIFTTESTEDAETERKRPRLKDVARSKRERTWRAIRADKVLPASSPAGKCRNRASIHESVMKSRG